VIDLDIAAAWHRMFALHLELVLDGIETGSCDPDVVCDDSRCELGLWLAAAPPEFQQLAGYPQLVAGHRQFHQVACRMMRQFAAGDGDGAQQLRSGDFRAASAAVLAAIAALARECRTLPGATRGGELQPESLWDEALLIGVPAIDDQHKALAGLVARLRDRPNDDVHSEAVTDVLTAVGHLIALHFQTEEILIRRCGLPKAEIDAHVAAHNGMLDQITRINLAALDGRDLRAAEIFETLKTWVIDHVVMHDINLKPYVN